MILHQEVEEVLHQEEEEEEEEGEALHQEEEEEGEVLHQEEEEVGLEMKELHQVEVEKLHQVLLEEEVPRQKVEIFQIVVLNFQIC